MEAPEYRVISIGTLAAHPLWDERVAVRTGHATTTLVTTGEHRILVDPGLPGAMVEAHLSERSRVRADDITHVFLTSFRADHTRGLDRFPDAEWLVHEPERTAATAALADEMEQARAIGDPERSIDYLKRALEIDPQQARTWEALAAALTDAGLYEAALDAATRALELDSRLHQAASIRSSIGAILEPASD